MDPKKAQAKWGCTVFVVNHAGPDLPKRNPYAASP